MRKQYPRIRWTNGYGDSSGNYYPPKYRMGDLEIPLDIIEQVIKEQSHPSAPGNHIFKKSGFMQKAKARVLELMNERKLI
jgi:hypothetical protein